MVVRCSKLVERLPHGGSGPGPHACDAVALTSRASFFFGCQMNPPPRRGTFRIAGPGNPQGAAGRGSSGQRPESRIAASVSTGSREPVATPST